MGYEPQNRLLPDRLSAERTTIATLSAPLPYRVTPSHVQPTSPFLHEPARVSTPPPPSDASSFYFGERHNTWNAFPSPLILDPRLLHGDVSNQLYNSSTSSGHTDPFGLPGSDWLSFFEKSPSEKSEGDAEANVRIQDTPPHSVPTPMREVSPEPFQRTFASCHSNRSGQPGYSRVKMVGKPYDCWRQIQPRHALAEKKRTTRQGSRSKKDELEWRALVRNGPSKVEESKKGFYCLCCFITMENENDMLRHTGKHLTIRLHCPRGCIKKSRKKDPFDGFARDDPLRRHILGNPKCLAFCNTLYGTPASAWRGDLAILVLGSKMYDTCTLLFHEIPISMTDLSFLQGCMRNDRLSEKFAHLILVSLKMFSDISLANNLLTDEQICSKSMCSPTLPYNHIISSA